MEELPSFDRGQAFLFNDAEDRPTMAHLVPCTGERQNYRVVPVSGGPSILLERHARLGWSQSPPMQCLVCWNDIDTAVHVGCACKAPSLCPSCWRQMVMQDPPTKPHCVRCYAEHPRLWDDPMYVNILMPMPERTEHDERATVRTFDGKKVSVRIGPESKLEHLLISLYCVIEGGIPLKDCYVISGSRHFFHGNCVWGDGKIRYTDFHLLGRLRGD